MFTNVNIFTTKFVSLFTSESLVLQWFQAFFAAHVVCVMCADFGDGF